VRGDGRVPPSNATTQAQMALQAAEALSVELESVCARLSEVAAALFGPVPEGPQDDRNKVIPQFGGRFGELEMMFARLHRRAMELNQIVARLERA